MPNQTYRPHTIAVQAAAPSPDPTAALRFFESTVADLENTQEAIGFSSGMLALQAAILTVVPPKGSLFVPAFVDEHYAALFDWLAQSLRIQVHRINFSDDFVNDLIEQVSPSAVLCQSIEHLTGFVPRIDHLAEVAHEAGSQLIVDNTLGAGYITQPTTFGADLVVHTSSVYLTNYPDSHGGAVCGPLELTRITRSQRDLLEAAPTQLVVAFWLQGLRTMPVRMNHACKSARQIAASLEAEPYITSINYPGISSDRSNETARVLLNRNTYGLVMTFDLIMEDVVAFIEQLEVILPSARANGARTTIFSPASLYSGESGSADQLHPLGLIIGLEDPNDIMTDILQAARYVIEMYKNS